MCLPYLILSSDIKDMSVRKNNLSISLLMLLIFPDLGFAKDARSFSVSLSASRIIYTSDLKSGATLGIENRQTYPVLVKAQVYREDQKSKANFILTPPLFRLDAQRSNLLRILVSNEPQSEKQETLNWLCVTAMPPDSSYDSQTKKVKSAVQVSVSSCIKLIYRPEILKEKSPLDATKDVEWRLENGSIYANNSSPFYINVSSLKVNGVNLDSMKYIPPFSSMSFDAIKNAVPGVIVEWRLVDDNGNNSRAIKSILR